MRLKEMIDLLRFPQRMQIRDEEGWEICACNTTSEGVLPYMNWVVTQWFGNYKDGKADFVVYVKETDDVPAEKERRMRLIDRDTLNEMLTAMLEKIGSENITWDDAMATIDHADDVDAVPVIRCRDCMYWRGNGKYCEYDMSGLEDDYCSWAERKEE